MASPRSGIHVTEHEFKQTLAHISMVKMAKQ